jgi:methylmalonyl-CoA/ethylmalonyl-CoA epimerase
MNATVLPALTFHHMGLAVKDDAVALTWLGALGYAPGERVFDPLQNVKVRLCTAEGRPTVELVQPGGEGPSPVDQLISRFNEMIYHTCYETADVDATLQAARDLGLKVLTLSPPKPAVLFGGRRVSFHRIQGFGVIELLERGSPATPGTATGD